MKGRIVTGLRARLLALVLLAVLPAVALVLYTAHRAGRFAAYHVTEEAQLLARLAAADYERLVTSTHQLLVSLAHLPAVQARNPGACNALFAKLRSGYTYYANLGAAAPDGEVFCSAERLKRPVNAHDRLWFRRAVETREFVIGEYQIGRITGKPVVVFSLPAYDERQQLRAVAFAALDLTWLNQLADKVELPRGATITLFDHRGVVLNHYPQTEWAGRAGVDSPLFRTLRAAPDFGTAEVAGVDGTPRLHAFAALRQNAQGGRLYVSIGFPREAAFAEIGRILARTLGGLAIAAALALAAAWFGGNAFLLRRIRALVDATRRLGRGELAARSQLPHGRDELGQLSLRFDEMAASLEAHAREVERANAALRASEERFRSLVETTSDWIWEVDASGVYTYSSPKVHDLLGYAPEEVVGRTPFDLMPPEETGRVRRLFADAVAARAPFERLENVNLHRDGRRVTLETSGVPLFDAHGALLGWRGIDRDISARKQAEERLRYLAYHDELTGLPNRALLLDRLRQATVDAARRGRRVALLWINLDRLKYVNETLGHAAGDALLRAAAARIQESVRPGDTVARLEGDQFAVVYADVAQNDDTYRVVHRLNTRFVEPMAVDERSLHATLSIGITLFPADGNEPETLLRNAESAMHQAKDRGGNGHVFYSERMTAVAAERLALENDLRRALERREFRLLYQPQVDLKGGRVTGMEALIRWQHPERGLVSPAQFIPLAEEIGLIGAVGEWVLHEACARARAWHKAGLDLRVAVNLSAQQFRDPRLAGTVRHALEAADLEPCRLEVELTESVLAGDPEVVAAVLGEFERLGVHIAIDDFGTGYSSLSYLKRFPVDVLKIDRAFVRDLATDPDDAAIVQATIGMAHALGLRTVAEGVETPEQLEFLRRHGCDAMQGYLFSPPVEASEAERLARTQCALPA